MPGGAIVDAARSERGVAALAMIAISASALVIALWPIFPSVLGAIVDRTVQLTMPKSSSRFFVSACSEGYTSAPDRRLRPRPGSLTDITYCETL
jgi:hypothetical protein